MNSIIEQLEEQSKSLGEINFEADNFICRDWNVYYNLHNPENFEDPEDSPEWYVASEVYKYYETPLKTTDKLNFYSSEKVENFKSITDLINKWADIEKMLLDAIVHYTFGNGGAYASAKYYVYAKKTMEILHETKFSNEEFIKRNLRIKTIEFGEEDDEIALIFDCSWDEEHGLIIRLKNNELIAFE